MVQQQVAEEAIATQLLLLDQPLCHVLDLLKRKKYKSRR
jgi:hypothetical protein